MKQEQGAEQMEPMSEQQLLLLVESLQTKLRDVEVAYGGQPKMFEEHKQLYEEFIEKLLAQKNGFAHIFKTEKGSIYFILPSGKSMRIKNLKYGYELQPIADKIEFAQEGSLIQNMSLGIGLEPYETFHGREKMKQLGHRGHKITEILK